MSTRLETGPVCFYRPKREKPRLFTPAKLGDIYTRVCSEFGPRAAREAVEAQACYQQLDEDCRRAAEQAVAALEVAATGYIVLAIMAEALAYAWFARLLGRTPIGAALVRGMGTWTPEVVAQRAAANDDAIQALRRALGEAA